MQRTLGDLALRELDEVLNRILVALREELKENLCSVVIIGSASRPLEYVNGLSDIDIVAIVMRKPSTIERYKVLEGLSGLRANVLFLRSNDVIEIIKSGYPLGWWLFHDSIALYDNGTLDYILKSSKPVMNDYTMEVLKKSSLAALSVAVENYFMGYFIEGVNWLHKSLRYGVQWLLARNGLMPSSDQKMVESLKDVNAPPVIATCLQKLIAIRKRGKASNLTFRLLVNATVRALCLIYDVSYLDWTFVEMKMREIIADGTLMRISAMLDENKLKWVVWVMKHDLKTRKVIG